MKQTRPLPLAKFQIFAIAMIVVLLVPLVLYGYIGIFTRYVADDYETAGALARSGFWGAQQYWYQTWSGRVTYFALVTLVEMIGIQAVPFLTAACLGLWLVGLYWVLRQFCSIAGVKFPALTSVLGACLVLFVTLRSLNQIHQILFWQTGLLTYVNYLIFFTLGAGLLVWRLRARSPMPASGIELLLSFVFAFVSGGLSEISIALQITLIILGLGVLFAYRKLSFRKKALGMLGAALVGSLLMLAIMAIAPGNRIRSTDFEATPGLVSLIVNSLKYLFTFLGNWIDKQPILVAFLVLLSTIAGLFTAKGGDSSQDTAALDRRMTITLILSAAAVFLCLWSGFFTSFYVMSAQPPERALVIPQFVLVAFIGFWSFQCGRLLSRCLDRPRITPHFWALLGSILLAVCLLLGPLYSSLRIAGTIAESRQIAAEWDQRDAVIREAVARGEGTVTVWYIQDLNRLGDYSTDPDFLVNRAAADYYHLDSIIALDKE